MANVFGSFASGPRFMSGSATLAAPITEPDDGQIAVSVPGGRVLHAFATFSSEPSSAATIWSSTSGTTVTFHAGNVTGTLDFFIVYEG